MLLASVSFAASVPAGNFGNAFVGLGYVLTPLLFSLFATLALGYKTGVSIVGNVSVGATVQQSLGIAVAMAALLFLIALFISRVGKQAR